MEELGNYVGAYFITSNLLSGDIPIYSLIHFFNWAYYLWSLISLPSYVEL